jgi:hypothetical protein
LKSNLTLLNILMMILARIKSNPDAGYKLNYMERVDEFESEKEVMINRLRLRKYLRDLVRSLQRTKEGEQGKEEGSLWLDALEKKLEESSSPYL